MIFGSRWEISIDGSRLWWLQGPMWTFRCHTEKAILAGWKDSKPVEMASFENIVTVTPTWFIMEKIHDFIINVSLVNS